MPLIRCPKCGQGYDVPGAVAARLTNSIATCHCGEWIAGSKAQVLAGMLNPESIKEIDLQPYRFADPPAFSASAEPHQDSGLVRPRSIRVVARGEQKAVTGVYTIGEHPLWIGSRGCHVELADSELSIKHCSISVRGDEFVVRDAESHMGTFLDGQRITEIALTAGTHVLRAGSALITIEPTEEQGTPVEPVTLDAEDIFDESVIHAMEVRASAAPEGGRLLLVCIDGALIGQEFEIPPGGLIVGREGHVRVPDEFLSRKHFEVVADPEGNVRVRDLGSRNGTFLNTMPASNTKVQRGDEIRAGVNRFRIEVRA